MICCLTCVGSSLIFITSQSMDCHPCNSSKMRFMYMVLKACTYGISFGCAAAVCKGSFRLQTLVSSALMLTCVCLSRKLFPSKFSFARDAHGPVSHIVLAGDMRHVTCRTLGVISVEYWVPEPPNHSGWRRQILVCIWCLCVSICSALKSNDGW